MRFRAQETARVPLSTNPPPLPSRGHMRSIIYQGLFGALTTINTFPQVRFSCIRNFGAVDRSPPNDREPALNE